jgi:hypothetical protein
MKEQEVLEITNPYTFPTFNILQRYATAQKYRILHIWVQCISQHNGKNFAPSSYLKVSSNKTMIQINFAGMSITFYRFKLHLSNFNGS